MPSKGLMVLIILLVAGSIAGLSQVDFTRDVPHYPPGYMGDGDGAVRVTHVPPGDQPDPEPGQQPDPEDEPATDPSDENEIRIRNVKLTKLSPEGVTTVLDPGDGTLVRIDLDSEGAVLFGGINLGDWEFLATAVRRKLEQVPNAHIVVVPDRLVPWQNVHWVMDVAREAGATKIGLCGFPDGDPEENLLAELEIMLLPKDGEATLPDGMDELEISIFDKTDDKGVTYDVYGQDAADLGDLYSHVSSFNGDYADEYGLEYAKSASKTPWVIKAPATIATGHVLVLLDAVRRAAVYTVRFGGDIPARPGKDK